MSKPIETISETDLTTTTGGMRWEQFRRSTNIEDRRSTAAIARDQRWWDRTMNQPTRGAPTGVSEGQ